MQATFAKEWTGSTAAETNAGEGLAGAKRGAAGLCNGNRQNRALVEALCKSKVYRDYERAFTEATCRPVAFRSAESWQLPLHGKRHENPFCQMLAQKSRACAACLQVQEKLSECAARQAGTVVCLVGLSDTAVPVRLGD